MNLLVVLPILVPLATAVACLLAPRGPRVQALLSLGGAALLGGSTCALLARVVAEGTQVSALGSWSAPYGVVLVADGLSALMLLLPGVLAPLLLLQATLGVQREGVLRGFHPLAHFLLAGVCGAFLAGDLFNLYVWFEVLLIGSFGLICLGRRRDQLVGAVKYVAMNLLASVLFLAAVGLLYGATGTLNLADLRERVLEAGGATGPPAVLLLTAFAIKAALVPFSAWLPESYPTLPSGVAALFSALLTKVGVYALLRLFTLLFDVQRDLPPGLLPVLAALTMTIGVLGAAVQKDMAYILGFHTVSQMGYILWGLALHSRLALAGAIVFVLHHAVVKSNLFLVSGLVQRVHGSTRLERCGGMVLLRPAVALVFGVSALSLAGVPPFSGFVAKLALVRAGLEQERHVLVGVALAVGLVTLFSMTKVWSEVFWKPAPAPARSEALTPILLVVPTVLAGLVLAIGLGAGPLMELALASADALLDPAPYVRAVLGGP